MSTVFYLVAGVASLLLGVLQLMMFARALLSWFPLDEDSAVLRFLHAATEPFIIPVRAVLERFEFFASSPLDMSFFIAFILISILQSLL